MAIKGGQILHVAGGPSTTFVVDRIQTAGITGLNINEDRLEELGNYEAIGTVRDIPDLTFEIESFDATTELESLLTGGDNTEANGTGFVFTNYVPLDIISPFKNSGLYTVGGTVAIPFLSLESMSYNMSLTDSTTMTATLRGDSVFYIPGSAYMETFDGDGATATFSFANAPALQSVIGSDTYFALSVMVFDGTRWNRQRLGTHYTNDASGVTFQAGFIPAAGSDNIKVIYGSATVAEYLQTVHDTTKPAGVRGRDIEVQLGNGSDVYTDWLGVQSANVDWRVTLERDEEFGNPQVVAQDFDVPEVSGAVTMKPSTVNALFAQVQAIGGISGTDIANATQDPPELEVRFQIKDPESGAVLKTLDVQDAKWTMPQIQGNVGQKLEQDFNFTSSSGVLTVYKGAAP